MINTNKRLLLALGCTLMLSCKEAQAPLPVMAEPTDDSEKSAPWKDGGREMVKDNLLKGCYVEASSKRGRTFAPCRTNDEDEDTYWATEDGTCSGSLTFTLNEASDVNRILIQEYTPLGQRVKRFQLEYQRNGQWKPLEATDPTTTVGYKRIIRFRTVKAEKLRIHFVEARGPLCINNVEAFLVPALQAEPQPIR